MPVESSQPRKELSLFDATAIIVGVIIGAGLYQSSPTIAGSVMSVGQLMGVWIAGGAFALVGALCYAELATRYPQEGGDYVFLTRAFGRRAGFLFAWLQLWVVRPGSIGAMAYVFGVYLNQLAPAGDHGSTLYACLAIAALTLVNVLGVKPGKWTQDALTVAKVVGLASVVVLGLLVAPAAEGTATIPAGEGANLRLAMILVLFTYGGWNEMAYVAAEVREPQRNIVRAMLLGTMVVALVYVSVNLTMVRTLGLGGMATSSAVAAEVVERAVGAWGGWAVSVLICVSALGSMNGMTFTGARIYYAMGRDHRLFAPWGRWHPRLGTPVNSLITEAVITVTMIVALAAIGGSAGQRFERLVVFTSPFFWMFLLLTGLSLLVLRRREGTPSASFRVPLYPLSPLAFMAVCGFMTWSSVTYAYGRYSPEAWWAIGVSAAGALLALRRDEEN